MTSLSIRLEDMAERFQPTSADEVKETVAWAVAEAVPLEVIGAGSKRGLGRPVEAVHELHLGGLSGVELYEPEELVMSARAGTPLAEIEARLADNRQQLAFEPPDYGAILGGAAGAQSIGGLFACNLAGPRRIKAGAARDHLLGVQAVTGRGDLIKSGGRVMKNVTGYDLCKLLTGSHGTLAVMTVLTFKVLPAPAVARTLVVASRDRGAALGALRIAMGSAADVSAAACLPPTAAGRSTVPGLASLDGHLALARIEGPEPSVQTRLSSLQSLLATPGDRRGELVQLGDAPSATVWREIRDLQLLEAEGRALWRLSVPPTSAAAVLDSLAAELTFEWLGDWAGGCLWLAVDSAEAPPDAGAAVIRGAIAAAGGHATLIRGRPELRAAIEVFQPQPAPLAALSARVKDSFDPRRILNRGRMYQAH